MNRLAWMLLAAFVVGAAASLFLVEDNGYVMMHMRGWTVETSLTAFAIALLVSVIALWLLLGILRGTLKLPGRVAGYVQEGRARKAYRGLVDGLRHFMEGDWEKAETELLRRVGDARDQQVNYLFAAIAANRSGATDRRDNFLRQAARCRDGSELAVLMAQARIQMNNGQETEALATLARLRELAPQHPQVLYRLIVVNHRAGDWDALIPLLEEARQLRAMQPDQWRRIAIDAWTHKLAAAARQSLDALRDSWALVPKDLRREPAVEAVYVRQLCAAGEQKEGLKIIVDSLRRAWNPQLALQFAELQADDDVSQLASVEAWLREHGDKPELLLTAARLCLRNQLWGRARSYLDACIAQSNMPEAWAEMGRLHDAQGNQAQSIKAYRTAAGIWEGRSQKQS